MKFGEAFKDVITGKAALEGAKVVGRGLVKGAQRGFEAIDKRVDPKGYARDKAAYQRIQANKKKRMQSSDGYMILK